MSAQRYLAESERIALEVHRHVAVLLRPFLITVGAIVAASFFGAAASPDEGGDVVDTVAGLVVIFFALRFFWKAIEWWANRIIVSDQRIFEISGVLTRRVASMPLTKVTDMTYRRTVWGRIFRYGDLLVETPGQHQALSAINYLPHPDAFYRTVASLVTARMPYVDNLERVIRLQEEGEMTHPEDEDTGPLPRVIL